MTHWPKRLLVREDADEREPTLQGGHLGRAIPLLEQTLAGMERIHGPDHTATRTVRAF
ncbi:hypothetical protein J5X84_44580 [Streptosporangiaceae bacterium NEAU-GS5]|nr:hypothetical protein [Streptosporangiaceae bacterium NEAU-GS5]